MKKYDYVLVGAGLYSGVIAYLAGQAGKSCLVLERRDHTGGNIYCEEIEGIHVHKYGAHIFHTSNKEVWQFVNSLAEFNRYTNSPIANYKGEIYNMPFNMNTFSKMWGIRTPEEAKTIIEEQRKAVPGEPKNLEEQAIKLVGKDIYEKLVKGYTEKQWGRRATELPSFIIRRLPVRYVYDNNYFNDKYQGIPVGGYTKIIERMLEETEVRLMTDFFADREILAKEAENIVFTGMIDAYYDYCFGELEYRSLRFETEVLDMENYQGNAVVNYTEYEVPYTRIIEHKHFEYGCQGGYGGDGSGVSDKTVITREYPAAWSRGEEPYYPMNDEKNNALYARYRELADQEEHVIFGGRLGMYRYYDMHQVVKEALKCVRKALA